MKKKFFVLTVFLPLFVLGSFGCKQEVAEFNTTLSMWGVFDNEGDYKESLSAYAEAHPFVDGVSYRKLSIDTYKKDLINSLASGTNPDIFMIHSTWVPEFVDKVVPAPTAILSPGMVQSQFVDVVAADTIFDNQVYGVAPSVDSLALYYNKDVFNAAGITSPPATWDEFDDVVRRIRRIGEDGRILQSGAAFGTSTNINRSMDLLTVLMMQGGAEMARSGVAQFNEGFVSGGESILPGRDSLLYYTSFARGGSKVYTWNKAQHYSIDAFTEGGTAMTISYSYNYDAIKAKNEKLNFAVAPLPQIDNETLGRQVNYPNYWLYVVAKNREIPPRSQGEKFQVTNEMKIWEAWQFLKAFTLPSQQGVAMVSPLQGEQYALSFPFDLGAKYLERTGKPAARKDLIGMQQDDVRLSPFARGNLIARSWFRKNADEVDQVFADMIDSVNRGQSVEEALGIAESRVNQLIR